MKKLIAVLFVSLVMFVGCNDQNSITSPDVADSPQWIELNSTSMAKVEAEYVEKEIKGSRGGLILFRLGYLYIPPKSFSGKEVISVANDQDLAFIDFGPSMEFDKDLYLTVIYTDLDLSGINPNTVEFGYLENGQFVASDYSRIVVNVDAGVLAVYGAKLNHFSRYGFLK
jgi:hypothetical protein